MQLKVMPDRTDKLLLNNSFILDEQGRQYLKKLNKLIANQQAVLTMQLHYHNIILIYFQLSGEEDERIRTTQ